MSIEDFVTYEQAVKLKELGFNWFGEYKYVISSFCNILNYTAGNMYHFSHIDVDNEDKIIPAPTLSQTAKWLREEKGLYINIWLCAAGYSWNIEKCGDVSCNGTFVVKHDEISGDDENSGLFTSYEKALSSGITKALEIIEK